MVLQRNKPVPVWGKATPGNSITITFNGQNLATTADDSGNWKVILSPMTAGGPFVMSIRQAVGEHLEVSCRKIGAQPLICVNITPSPTMTNVVQDACDFIEYCNGSVTSKWGAIRAANGHPEPYNVRQWEIGNE